MSDFPILLQKPETLLPKLGASGSLYVSAFFGTVTAGQTVLASDGPRFIWYADSANAVYSQGGKFYKQTAKGFAAEVQTSPFVEAGRRSLFMARVAEVEMKWLLGILAGSSGTGFALVIGSEIAEFIVTNRNDFTKWTAQYRAVLEARDYLKRFAPTLYEKVFNSILHRVFRDWWSNVPDAITSEAVAFGVGVVIGGVGKKVAAGRFSLWALIFLVVEQLCVRFALSVSPEAFKLTEAEYRRTAAQIIEKLKGAGVNISDQDIKKIVDEVRGHPNEIRKAYDLMKASFSK
ncbi:hypothetical protein P0D75_06685 [Paraburkholderia sediminicola]|uniref:hypothetical protein n=1 Tax=Paraburkholderia sediminicola TaxID=458836 RepID=UPI0038BA9FE6